MPLVSVAVCPHPPLLVPEIAGTAAGELDDLRSACDDAVDRLVGAGTDTIVVLGAGDHTRWLPRDSYASFAPFGVSIEFSLGACPVTPCDPGPPGDRVRLPLSLSAGAWLLGRGRHRLPSQAIVEAVSVAGDARAADCASVAGQLRDRPERVALLVMGDGSACRGELAPGYDDPRARPYDDHVARALDRADTDALRGLDPELSAELLVAGRAPWRVLADAATGAWRGYLSYYAAPYGVAYFVASWEPV